MIDENPKCVNATTCPGVRLQDFQEDYRQWVEMALQDALSVRDARWSEAVAVGNLAFVKKVKSELGINAADRQVIF